VNCQWKLVTAPTEDPVTIEDARAHMGVTDTTSDGLVLQRIKAATRRVENYLHRGILTQTWKYAQDNFTNVMSLPMAAPLQSAIVTYYDASGVLQTLSTSVYGIDTVSEPGCIYLKPNQVWPSVQAGRPLAVEIDYVVGWTSVDDVPADFIIAIYLIGGSLNEFTETMVDGPVSAIPEGAEAFLGDRVFWREPCEVR
jgi:uncharacterized phiE125 gp8 family phage protein